MQLQVLPGRGLSAFALGELTRTDQLMCVGMTLVDCVACISELGQRNQLSKTEIKYTAGVSACTLRAYGYCIALSIGKGRVMVQLSEEGILLHFARGNARNQADALPLEEQRLECIEVTRFQRVALSYERNEFAGPEHRPTHAELAAAFGPTLPGRWDNDDYVLSYPGIEFLFSLHEHAGKQPAELPEGVVMLCSRIILRPTRALRSIPLAPPNEHYMQPIVYVLGSSEILFPSRQATLSLGCTAQEATMLLGSPESVYRKPVDRVKIHSGDERVRPHFIYNYFRLGFDLLFDEGDLAKIILRTNYPNHTLFARYHPANFLIVDRNSSVVATFSTTVTTSAFSTHLSPAL
jgi:hypothetical protein